MNLYDKVSVVNPRLTKEGYLVAEARVARTGVQKYLASELGMDGDQNRVINVYRSPEEVFSVDAMASYAFRPVTVDHPPEMVDAKNWRQYSRGQTGPDIMRDGEFVRVPMLLMDETAINEWRAGKRELSFGYMMDLELKDGVTPEGEKYEAIQRNLRMNHLAVVAQARGGSQLKLGDNLQEELVMSNLKNVLVDGLQVETTEAGAQAISKLQGELKTARDSLVEAGVKHGKELDAKDTLLAQKDAEVDGLKGKVLSDADLDKLVQARSDLITAAKNVADVDYSGQSAEEIRKTAVAAVKGNDSVAGKSAAYIEARFDQLVEDAGSDAVRNGIRNGLQQQHGKDASAAYADMKKNIGDAWRGNNGGAQ